MSEDTSYEALKLFYSLLVSYELALKEILGSGQAVFVQPVLNNFTKLNEVTGLRLRRTQSVEETLQRLSKIFEAAGLLRRFQFEKLDENRYVMYVNGCCLAPHVHKELEREGFLCPYALMAMSIFQKQTGGKIKFSPSEFLEDGSKTFIEVV
jgi:hypothetical protein